MKASVPVTGDSENRESANRGDARVSRVDSDHSRAGECIGGAISPTKNPETNEKWRSDGERSHQSGIIPGIKVDAGAKDMAAYPVKK